MGGTLATAFNWVNEFSLNEIIGRGQHLLWDKLDIKWVLCHKDLRFMKVEHAFGAAKSSCTGRTHSTGEAQRRLQRPFFKQSGNKAGVEGISRARFIDAVYLVSSDADDLIAVTGQRAALTHSDYHHTVRIQPG